MSGVSRIAAAVAQEKGDSHPEPKNEESLLESYPEKKK
jgi:hypothetical protein